jgi:hypothetical protein
MRARFCTLLSAPLLLTSVGLLAHVARANAQGVTPESLYGRSIEASVIYQQRVRLESRGEFDTTVRADWRLNIGGDGKVNGTFTRSSTAPSGRPISTSRQFSAVIGRPRQVGGGGHSVMILSGNTLTVLRTFEVGGSKTTITFSGGGCSIRSPIVQEVGAGRTRRDAIAGGGTVEIISARQVSSSCRMTR